MNIAVVDDNISFVDDFCNIIERICESYKFDYKIDKIYGGYSIVENYNNFDLIFLDIEMPDIDGIEVANQINKLKRENDTPFIVFVTNKDNLVFNALKQYPYSFIRKTHFNEDVEQCLVNIISKIKEKTIKYTVKDGRMTKFLNPKDIMYIEKEKNYVVFHTKDRDYKERSKIDEKSEDLSEFGFVRTHIGYLVNMSYVEEMTNTEFTLYNGTKIPISKTYKDAVKEQYFDWMVKQYG